METGFSRNFVEFFIPFRWLICKRNIPKKPCRTISTVIIFAFLFVEEIYPFAFEILFITMLFDSIVTVAFS